MNTRKETTDTEVYLGVESGRKERSRKSNYWVLGLIPEWWDNLYKPLWHEFTDVANLHIYPEPKSWKKRCSYTIFKNYYNRSKYFIFPNKINLATNTSCVTLGNKVINFVEFKNIQNLYMNIIHLSLMSFLRWLSAYIIAYYFYSSCINSIKTYSWCL